MSKETGPHPCSQADLKNREEKYFRTEELIRKTASRLPSRLQDPFLLTALLLAHRGISFENHRQELGWEAEKKSRLSQAAIEEVARYKQQVAKPYARLRQELHREDLGCHLEPSCSEYAARLLGNCGFNLWTTIAIWRALNDPRHQIRSADGQKVSRTVPESLDQLRVLPPRLQTFLLASLGMGSSQIGAGDLQKTGGANQTVMTRPCIIGKKGQGTTFI